MEQNVFTGESRGRAFPVQGLGAPKGGPKLYVAVAGNIGAGKTTLTSMLMERYGWEPHFEAVMDNPYLQDFYDDMNRWSFPIQIFFLNSRYKAHKRINQSANSAIQDRSIYEDAHIFARNLHESGHMEKRDYQNYLELYREMCSTLTAPDLLVYLRKGLPKLRENIRARGRGYEENISSEYLANLNRYYDEWIDGYSNGKVLVLESDDLDFVQRPRDFDLVCHRIEKQFDQQELFLFSKTH